MKHSGVTDASDTPPAADPPLPPLTQALLDRLDRPTALRAGDGRLVAMNAAFRRCARLEDPAIPLPIRLVEGRLWDGAGRVLPAGPLLSSALRTAPGTGSVEGKGGTAEHWQLVELNPPGRQPPGAWGSDRRADRRADRLTDRLADRLAEAIAGNRLGLLYQPIVALDSGRIEGVEVLCRWQDPLLGSIEPSQFIAVAEATGQIHALGSWLIGRVFAQLRRWQALPGGPVSISINLSPRQLQRRSLVDDLQRGLERQGLRAEQVTLEITEDQSIEPGSAAHEHLLELHRLGFCLAMDDYGSGYAGLHQLNRLPFTAVKTDRHLIEAIETDRLQQAMVQGAVDLQNTAGMRVVVEGVERASQRQRLLELGCRLAQGFLFARPMEAAELEQLLRLPQLPAPAVATLQVQEGPFPGLGP